MNCNQKTFGHFQTFLTGHFQTFLTAISPEILEEKKMVIGLETDPKAQKHRKNVQKEFIYFYNKKHSSPK